MKYKNLLLLASWFMLQNCTQPNKPAEENQATAFYTMNDFDSIEKIDAHVHINTNTPYFVQQAAADNFKLVTINLDDVNEPPPMEEQQKFALQQVKAAPGSVAYATTFSIRHFNDAGWLQQNISYMQNSFAQGAVAVKIYKVIGMALRDKKGRLVMIDDERFDTLINFIEQNNKTVVGHLGEPKNCWLPVDSMTIKGDKNYFTANPIYHMYLHPEYPSYEAQIAARDNMLRKHPNLRFVGAHLGSLEWSVDELAKRLDEFPNMAVDMAARICHLQYQASKNWQKVHDFMMKYQDRLIYATDLVTDTMANTTELKAHAHTTWLNDWKFFATDSTMTVNDFDGSFKGLQLPCAVIDKIYRKNAEKWFPGAYGKR
jgi:hypothetical protein